MYFLLASLPNYGKKAESHMCYQLLCRYLFFQRHLFMIQRSSNKVLAPTDDVTTPITAVSHHDLTVQWQQTHVTCVKTNPDFVD